MKQIFQFIFLLVFFYSCEDASHPEFETQVVALEQRVADIECRKMQLKHQIDSVWNVVTSSMEKDLPKDMEAGAKANLLGLKARHLIQMLPEYNGLSSESKQLISEAAVLDSITTLQFSALLKEYDAYEMEMKNFLQATETKSASMRKQYLKRLQSAQKEACKAE